MTQWLVDAISDAILYEGYLLYPYRESATKNQFRWMFGCLYPEVWCEKHDSSARSFLQSEILIQESLESSLDVRLRCLVIATSDVDNLGNSPDAVEREWIIAGVCIRDLVEQSQQYPFLISTSQAEDCSDEATEIAGRVTLQAVRFGDDIIRISIRVDNETVVKNGMAIENGMAGDRDVALRQTLISTQLSLRCHDASFISVIDPPDQLRECARACKNDGFWPVLAGAPGSHNQLLILPIILDDYPKIAPESAGNLFDGTEIDEVLSMRIRTLSENEKAEMRAAGPRVRQVLERAEQLGEDDLRRMHGTIRQSTPSPFDRTIDSPVEPLIVNGVHLRAGDRVRLRPQGRNDIFDLALAGRIAVIESIQQDFEDTKYVAVCVEDDPGRDFGRMGLPGHRFFFRSNEVELLTAHDAEKMTDFREGDR